MDDFAVDLDKVLDDFELSEGGDTVGNGPPQLVKTPPTTPHSLIAPTPQDGIYVGKPLSSGGAFILESEPLDLSGADFAPSLSTQIKQVRSEPGQITEDGCSPQAAMNVIEQNGHDSGTFGDRDVDAVNDEAKSGENHECAGINDNHADGSTYPAAQTIDPSLPSLLRKKEEEPPGNLPLFTSKIPGPNNGALDMMHILSHQKSPRDSGISVSSEMPSLLMQNDDVVPSPTSSMDSPQHHMEDSPPNDHNTLDYISVDTIGDNQGIMSSTDSGLVSVNSVDNPVDLQQPLNSLNATETLVNATPSECTASQTPDECVYNAMNDSGKSNKLDLMSMPQQHNDVIVDGDASIQENSAEITGTAGLGQVTLSIVEKGDDDAGNEAQYSSVPIVESVSQPTSKPVGFGSIEDDEDVDMDDMDAYLKEMESGSVSIVAEKERSPSVVATSPSLDVEIGQAQHEQSKTDELRVTEIDSSESLASSNVSSPGRAYHASGSGSERRSSGGSVEKFLAPSLIAPGITTPMDDPGFTKVPGYAPEAGLPHLLEDETCEDDDAFEGEEICQAQAGGEETGEDHKSLEVNAAFHVGENVMSDISSGCDVQSSVVSECVVDGTQVSSSALVQDDVSFAGIVTVIPKSSSAAAALTDESAAAEGMVPIATAAASASLPSTESATLADASVTSDGAVSGLDVPPSSVHMPIPSSDLSNDDAIVSKSPTGTGARPKEPTHIKRNRPNSLLGLSKPDLKLAVPVGSCSDVNLNPNMDGYAGGCQSEDVHMTDPSQPPRMHPHNLRLDLKPDIDLNSPVPPPVFPSESIIPHDAQAPLNHKRPGSLNLPPPEHSLNFASLDDHSQTEASGELADEQSEPQPKQKRPTSLNFAPRRQMPVTLDSSDSPMDGVHLNTAAGSTPYLLQPNENAHQIGSSLESGPGPQSPPMSCANMNNLTISQLGKVAPQWVPDAEAPTCMQCDSKFTFTKRRHHCRACGKVFCSACCSLKCKLEYKVKEARVCSKCYQDIVRAQAYERLGSSIPDGAPLGGADSPARVSPNPNNPAEYCSTIPPLQQAADLLNTPPPTVMVPVGVLRKQGSQRNREPKQVMFSDGIRPGGDLTELDAPAVPRLPLRKSGRMAKKVEQANIAAQQQQASTGDGGKILNKKRVVKPTETSGTLCLIPEVGLPPILPSVDSTIEQAIEDEADQEIMLTKISNTDDMTPVVFAINKNLFVLVKLVDLECCVNRTCWCFTTKGLCTVGQDEVVIVLECLPDESSIPRDIFCHLHSVYEQASKGNTVSHLGHTIFGQSFLGSKEHCGFLYIRPTFQCLQKLLLPQAPYVFGILLQRWETPWAKVFPIRLMLRLGAEYRYYPCPLVSVRFRKPVFGEIGHTIMNLLADFRNFQYMLPQIRGVTIHMQDKQTFISFPRNRYEDVMKVVGSSNEHVMALGANFSMLADSHLVCIQNDDGNYHTQAINIQNKPRKITGASFVVFNGALKSSSGLRAKSSIVEDGLMVQITPEAMVALKTAMHEMRDFTIGCGSIDTSHADEQVHVQWTEDDHQVNIGVRSPIDNMVMDGVESLHIHHATDYVGKTRTIRWTEVFFITTEEGSVNSSRCEPVDLSRLAETLAQACCMALVPQLDTLKEATLTRIGLRINISSENVGYEIGANGAKLPDFYMNDLDNELIPVIHNAASQSQEGPVSLELIFHIIE